MAHATVVIQPGDQHHDHVVEPVHFTAQSGAVQMQPVAIGGVPPPPGIVWMPKPPYAVPNCPPGLEYLSQLDQLLVSQVINVLQEITGWEASQKYQIRNILGQQCYYAFEESGVCMRQCCGESRSFFLHIVDNFNNEVMRLYRPYRHCCGSCCVCCGVNCTPEIQVEAPVGNPIGYIVSDYFNCNPSFRILDSSRNPIYVVQRKCACVCGADIDFHVYPFESTNRVPATAIGKISKQWSGLAQEMFTEAHNFGIVFPKNADVRMKATMIGALFLIDFLFFERKASDNKYSFVGALLS